MLARTPTFYLQIFKLKKKKEVISKICPCFERHMKASEKKKKSTKNIESRLRLFILLSKVR